MRRGNGGRFYSGKVDFEETRGGRRMAPIHFLCLQIFSASMNLVQVTTVENALEDDMLDATSSTIGGRHCMQGFCQRSTLGLHMLLAASLKI